MGTLLTSLLSILTIVNIVILAITVAVLANLVKAANDIDREYTFFKNQFMYLGKEYEQLGKIIRRAFLYTDDEDQDEIEIKLDN